ncbi:MAG TPA: orotidine-5'-phosphate decarboxylase [Candidatus Anoxymicrobiaceae bacterium]
MKEKRFEGLSPLILALDTSDLDGARRLADRVRPYVDIVKIGLQLYSHAGVEAVKSLKEDGFEVFLDIKMMDIPNTVASACIALCEHEPLMLTLHTMGGQEMMRAAEQAVRTHCEEAGLQKPLLIGVTVLTSFDLLALAKIGIAESIEAQVIRLAKLARDSGVDGLVSSPLETLPVRREVGPDMVLITPGVRLPGASMDDQKRVATPAAAMKSGADFLVVGRPLYQAPDPLAVAAEMLKDVKRASPTGAGDNDG